MKFFFMDLRWQDYLDIALNSYILFRMYVLFRGTNTFRIMLALACLWFFQQVAVSIGLVVTSWLIQGVTAAAAIIIIVIFRNEIRSVFQTRNLKSIFWGIQTKTDKTPVEVIGEAIFELAKKRTGALVVIPGREDLSEQVRGGIPWLGRISGEMIETIFWRNNPVHDGAAIVEGNRISLVGGILPLSHRKDLPSYFGTRHRAAAGLAESSDALVIAVSEERGRVAVATGSELREIGNREELEAIIRSHTGEKGPHLPFYQRERFGLGVAAVLSVLLIAGVWGSFMRSKETLITLEAPIRYLQRKTGMEVVDTSDNSVRLHLSGAGALLRSLQPGQVQVSLDLESAKAGKNSFYLTSDNISLPPGIKLNRIDPPEIEVTVDVPQMRELPVQVDWVGTLPEGLLLREVKLSPQRLRVEGRSMLLRDMATIYTEPVPLGIIRQSGEIWVKPSLPSPLALAPGQKETILIQYTVLKR